VISVANLEEKATVPSLYCPSYKPILVALIDLNKAFDRVNNFSVLNSLTSQSISGRIITWMEKIWQAKTKTMIFHINRHGRHKFKLGQQLEMTHKYKYLGITIDSRLTFTCHVEETKRKVYPDPTWSKQLQSCISQSWPFASSWYSLPTGLQLCHTVLRKNTTDPIAQLSISLWTSSILVYR